MIVLSLKDFDEDPKFKDYCTECKRRALQSCTTCSIYGGEPTNFSPVSTTDKALNYEMKSKPYKSTAALKINKIRKLRGQAGNNPQMGKTMGGAKK